MKHTIYYAFYWFFLQKKRKTSWTIFKTKL